MGLFLLCCSLAPSSGGSGESDGKIHGLSLQLEAFGSV